MRPMKVVSGLLMHKNWPPNWETFPPRVDVNQRSAVLWFLEQEPSRGCQ